MKQSEYFYLHCIIRLTIIILVAEILAMLLFDITGLENSLPQLVEAVLDGVTLVIFSAYPLYRLVYLPTLQRFKKSQEQVEMLAEALQGAGESVVITNPAGNIIYVNKSFSEVTGYTYEEIIGQNPNILQSGKQDHYFYQRMWSSINSHGKWKGELWNKRKDGELYPESLDIRAIYDENNDAKFFVGVFSDLTTQKRVENALLQTQKLEAVGTLVGGVAHNFNNLLAAISGKAYVGLSKAKKSSATSTVIKNLEDIQLLSFDASNLVKQLLTFARESQHDKINIALGAAIRDAVNTAEIGVSEDITLSVDIADHQMTVFADPSQLKQAIINLINNARDAVSDSETKKIQVRLYSSSPDSCDFQKGGECGIHCERMAILEVKDSGTGINSADIDKIFEPFFTTKAVGDGTGLGLSTAHGIITSHNGSITVDSAFLNGATFRVCLPLVEESIVPIQQHHKPQVKARHRTATILVSDDAVEVRKTVSAVLESFGHTVIQAVDGLDALEKFYSHQHEISLVITDIVMPNKNGADSVFSMREVHPTLPVIFMTGYDAPKQITAETLEQDSTALLHKPFKSSELSETVDQLLAIVADKP